MTRTTKRQLEKLRKINCHITNCQENGITVKKKEKKKKKEKTKKKEEREDNAPNSHSVTPWRFVPSVSLQTTSLKLGGVLTRNSTAEDNDQETSKQTHSSLFVCL